VAILALGAITPALTPAAHAAGVTEFAPTANFQYEWAAFDADRRPFVDNDAVRRARLGFRIKGASQRWQVAVEHDFADRTPADAYLELTPAKGHSLRVGQFKQPFLLDDAISDKHSALLEPSFASVFAISRRIGVEYARAGDRGTVNAAVFGQRLDGTNPSHGASVRATLALPAGTDGHAHVGFSLASESPDTGRASFSVAPGTTLTPLRLASTGSIAGVDRLDRAAIEALWMRAAWSLQAEVAGVATRGDGAGFRGDAQNVQLTWSPSGDARSYKRGVPGAPSAQDGLAWELALRWSAIDLDDDRVSNGVVSAPLAGGRVRQLGLGATCYVTPNLRVIANVLRLHSQRGGLRDDPTVAGLRVQLTY